MINWFKRNQEVPQVESLPSSPQQEVIPTEKTGFFVRFKKGLHKTRHQLGSALGRALLGKKEIDAHIFEELETILLSADVGIEVTQSIVKKLSQDLSRQQLMDGNAVFSALKTELQSSLVEDKSFPQLATPGPFVILMVGVNGAGKTTTIGKLAHHYQQSGKKVMLAAGDTFRAAAVEQLQAWGSRLQIPVIAQHTGADSASVIFDALQAAKARGIDILIADTAGRLHTQQHLMSELKKVKNVLKKLNPDAPHETMLVLDASIGQNALNQAREFNQTIHVTGITMTKLDGTAKGGILFAIANELKIPFRYIGLGEGVEDMEAFNSAQFVDAIFNDNLQTS